MPKSQKYKKNNQIYTFNIKNKACKTPASAKGAMKCQGVVMLSDMPNWGDKAIRR